MSFNIFTDAQSNPDPAPHFQKKKLLWMHHLGKKGLAPAPQVRKALTSAASTKLSNLLEKCFYHLSHLMMKIWITPLCLDLVQFLTVTWPFNCAAQVSMLLYMSKNEPNDICKEKRNIFAIHLAWTSSVLFLHPVVNNLNTRHWVCTCDTQDTCLCMHHGGARACLCAGVTFKAAWARWWCLQGAQMHLKSPGGRDARGTPVILSNMEV